MTTKYRTEIKWIKPYPDTEGWIPVWEPINDWTECSKAMALGYTVKKDDNAVTTGDWRIIARTIDEEKFTCDDKVFYSFDYYHEVELPYKYYEWIANNKKGIEEFKAILSKTRDPRKEVVVTRKIADYEKAIDFWKEKLKELGKPIDNV